MPEALGMGPRVPAVPWDKDSHWRNLRVKRMSFISAKSDNTSTGFHNAWMLRNWLLCMPFLILFLILLILFLILYPLKDNPGFP